MSPHTRDHRLQRPSLRCTLPPLEGGRISRPRGDVPNRDTALVLYGGYVGVGAHGGDDRVEVLLDRVRSLNPGRNPLEDVEKLAQETDIPSRGIGCTTAASPSMRSLPFLASVSRPRTRARRNSHSLISFCSFVSNPPDDPFIGPEVLPLARAMAYR